MEIKAGQNHKETMFNMERPEYSAKLIFSQRMQEYTGITNALHNE
jgi:hypothetical protein